MNLKNKNEAIDSQIVFRGKVFDVSCDQVTLPGGHSCQREVVRHPGAAVFIPQCNDGSLLLVKQYRHPLQQTILEFPAGTLEPAEEGLSCAKREISEEVGQRAEEWIDLGILYPAPGFCSEIQYCFLARKLSPYVLPGDEDEIIEIEKLSVNEVENAIFSGSLKDAKSIAVFFRARLMKLL